MIFRNLHVVFHAAGLSASRYPAVHPIGLVESLPRLRRLLGSKYVWNR